MVPKPQSDAAAKRIRWIVYRELQRQGVPKRQRSKIWNRMVAIHKVKKLMYEGAQRRAKEEDDTRQKDCEQRRRQSG